MGPATTPAPPLLLKLFGGAFGGMGSLACLVGLGTGVVSVGQQFGTEAARGTVVALESRRDADGTSHLPVVEYRVAGEVFRCKGAVSFSPPMHKVGETIGVRYERDRPAVGYVNSFSDRWLVPSMATGIGTVFVAVGVAFWRQARKREARARAGN